MKTNQWIAGSQHLYRWLLRLYPQAYRANYEWEMLHLFTDQCREAYSRGGIPGILFLWLRTVIDLGITIIREHLSDPHAKVGLLEAIPNAPLPWKGVLLVLIPGLIFFVSQVVQLTSTRDWFFVVFHRAGYFLILPVLLVWLSTRRFPVWGFIPLGLLYVTLWNYGQRVQLENLPIIRGLFTYESLELFGIQLSTYTWRYLFAWVTCLILLGLLIRSGAQRGQISRSAWKWLGTFGLLFVLRIAVAGYQSADWWVFPEDAHRYLFETTLAQGYTWLPFLLLVFIGRLFARQYQGFSFLVLLGYLLPTVIFGRYGDWNDYPIPFYAVSLAVITYRLLVALVAPVWLVRASSVPGRQRAAAIPVAIAIFCQLSLTLFDWSVVEMTWPDYVLSVWDHLLAAAGLGLAVALYLPRQQDRPVPSQPEWAASAE